MSTADFLRIAVTPPYIYPGEAEAIARALTDRGFDYVHIRKPGASTDEMRTLIEAIDPALRQRLTLHDCHRLAAPLGCGGIHLNSRNPHKPDDTELRVSQSCHSLDEASTAGGYSYIFLSPVFPSLSKPGYRSDILSAPQLRETLSNASSPVVALGGVTHDRIDELRELGFAGAAMLGAAWQNGGLTAERFALQLITHPYPGQDVAEGAAKAIAGGCGWVQLRHKDADSETLVAEGRAIASRPDRDRFTFIIDDHVELVDTIGADGVHLGKNDMPVAEARLLLGPGKIIGATANTLDDIRAAARDGADYIGLGPFRFTTTKEKLSPTLGLDGYRDIIASARRKGIRLPIVAIGGITAADTAAVMAAGADGIAISGYILGATDPVEATAEFIRILRNTTI